MIDKRELEIIELIKKNQEASSREIFEGISASVLTRQVKIELQ